MTTKHPTEKLTRQMTPGDCFQMTILSMAETSLNIMLDRAQPKSRRYNKIIAAKEKLDEIDVTFDGHLPDNFIAASQRFFTTVEAAMNTLLKTYKNGGN